MENVVTHAAHRGRGFARQIHDRATAVAWGQGCYKVMLLTASKDSGTLRLYEGSGFRQTMTGLQILRLPDRAS